MGILPPETIESAFGKEVGPEQIFIVALRSLVSRRIDLSAKQILASHRMQDSTQMDLNSLVKTIASKRSAIHENPDTFSEISQERKYIMVDNIQSLLFKDRVKELNLRYLADGF